MGVAGWLGQLDPAVCWTSVAAPSWNPRAREGGGKATDRAYGRDEKRRGSDWHEFYRRPDRHANYTSRVVALFSANSQLLVKRLEAVYRSDEPMPVIFEELADALLAEDPDAVGISVCYKEQLWVGICPASVVKERTFRPVIFGGIFFLHDPEQLILDFGDVIDFIVTGDGERALARLLERPERPEDVPGLCWSSRGKAVFFHNLTAEGNARHPMPRHVGEPVLSGEKWICNQWIRQGRVARPPAAKASMPPALSRGRRSRPHPRRRARARPRKGKRKR